MLSRIHYNHLGINKCKQRAREILYWPQMCKQIEDIVLNCQLCLKYQKDNQKEPLMPKDIPERPFQVVGTDLFNFRNKNYLILIDYYSKFVELALLSDLSSTTTIVHLKSIFARYGIPKLLYSDGGPQYSSLEFKNFANAWGFEHKFSSPYFAQSNGMVERAIQTIKKMLNKAQDDNRDLYLSLLEFRNTPISDSIPSPAQLLYNRQLNGLLPNKCDFFKGDINYEIHTKLKERQDKQKMYFDRKSKLLDNYYPGQKVMYRKSCDTKTLLPATIVKPCDRPRSYEILTEKGVTLERNRKHLYKGSNAVPPTSQADIEQSNIQSQDKKEFNSPPSSLSTETSEQPLNKLSPYQSQATDQKLTRSGRNVKKPLYLNDYY